MKSGYGWVKSFPVVGNMLFVWIADIAEFWQLLMDIKGFKISLITNCVMLLFLSEHQSHSKGVRPTAPSGRVNLDFEIVNIRINPGESLYLIENTDAWMRDL